MVVQGLATLAAMISCAGIAYATSRYLRVRHDFYLRNAWRATILLSIGLILSVHAITAGIDRGIGIPNAARWIENVLIACSGYFADRVHVAMVHGIAASRRQYRWTLVWLVAVVVALALLLWRADVPELASFSLPRPNPWLILYRFVWLSFLTFVIVRLIIYNWRFGHITPDPVIRLTTLAMVLAGIFACGVIVTTMAEPILPAASPAVYPLRVLLEVCVLGMATSFIFSTLPTWNPRFGGPAVAGMVVSASTYWQLSTLWRALTDAAPDVVLPAAVPLGDILRHPVDIDLLLQRRVVEILDGWRMLLGEQPTQRVESAEAIVARLSRLEPGEQPGSSATRGRFKRNPTLGEHIVESARATERHLQTMRASAAEDADKLVAALSGGTSGASDGIPGESLRRAATSSALLSFQPATYAEQVRYLELVARAFSGRRSRRRPDGNSRATRTLQSATHSSV